MLLILVTNRNRTLNFVLGGVGVPLALGTIAMGLWALKKENKRWTYGFMAGCVAGLLFVVYRLFRMRQADFEDDYKYSKNYLTFFGVIVVVHLVLCIVFAGLTSQRFGRGLQRSLQEGQGRIYEEDPAEAEARKRKNLDLDL
ncbi:hypothetical protein HDV00_002880 [Rhizophlyctis rosea]|nr:hypothetical protein HDV00_002880 [Rhizophlyctis rosea]